MIHARRGSPAHVFDEARERAAQEPVAPGTAVGLVLTLAAWVAGLFICLWLLWHFNVIG